VIVICLIDEIFLQSSVVQGIVPVKNMSKPLAKRVVLIVSDGLRYDTTFIGWNSDEEVLMPKLRARLAADESSICGASISQAPTESRACHTAMLAGFWEDMANLKVLWKQNFLSFDHVLDKVNYSWAFGGPDVVNFFTGENVNISSFPFSFYHQIPDTRSLDRWTVDKVKELFDDVNQKDDLNAGKNLLFLHLAGVDTAGHRHGPHSAEYRDNARYVDDLIEEIEHLTSQYFGDNNTAYIFTSDHGFADSGGHGTSDYNTVKSPFLMWGPKVFLDGAARTQCKQNIISERSINTIISMLLGVPYSTNNLELVPIQIIGVQDEIFCNNLLTNVEQIFTLLEAKKNLVSSKSLLYRILISAGLHKFDFEHLKVKFRELVARGDFKDAIKLCNEMSTILRSDVKSVEDFMPNILKASIILLGLALVIISGDESPKMLFPWGIFLITFILGIGTKNSLEVATSLILSLTSSTVALQSSWEWTELGWTVSVLACLAIGTFHKVFLIVGLVATFITRSGFFRKDRFEEGIELTLATLILMLVAFVPEESNGLKIMGCFCAIVASCWRTPKTFTDLPFLLPITFLTVSLISNYLSATGMASVITILTYVLHSASVFYQKLDAFMFGVHAVSVFGSGRQVLVFLALAVFAARIEQEHNGHEVLPQTAMAKTSSTGSDRIASLQSFAIVVSAVFLPIGLKYNGPIANADYRRHFGMDTAAALGVEKFMMVFSLFLIVQQKIQNHEFTGYLRYYMSWMSFSILLAGMVLLGLGKVGSWQEIGLGISRYLVCLVLAHAMGLIWPCARLLSRSRTFFGSI